MPQPDQPDLFSKACGGCGARKPLECFNKSRTGRLGVHNHCRECQKAAKARHYEANRVAEIERSRIRGQSQAAKLRRQAHYRENRDRLLRENRDRRNSPEARAKANEAKRRLEAKKPSAKLARNMRIRVRKAIRGRGRSPGLVRLLGCSVEALKEHIEGLFLDGMSWENYGYLGWHIDHIRPCASFDLTDPEQAQLCFHYTNLQPLWRYDNASKGGKWDGASAIGGH